MPQRDRTFMMVVTLICILAIAASLVNAAVRSGDEDEHHGDEQHEHSALMLVEAPASPAANFFAQSDPLAPADALA